MTPTEIKDGLVKALEHAQEGLALTDLEDRLNSGEALLWLGKRAALVTMMYNIPEGRFLHGWLATGDLDEIVEIIPGVDAWARARGCLFATINGRKGWSRVFKKLGFNMVDGELRKEYV